MAAEPGSPPTYPRRAQGPVHSALPGESAPGCALLQAYSEPSPPAHRGAAVSCPLLSILPLTRAHLCRVAAPRVPWPSPRLWAAAQTSHSAAQPGQRTARCSEPRHCWPGSPQSASGCSGAHCPDLNQGIPGQPGD